MRDLKEVREQSMKIPGEECLRQRDSTCKDPEVECAGVLEEEQESQQEWAGDEVREGTS